MPVRDYRGGVHDETSRDERPESSAADGSRTGALPTGVARWTSPDGVVHVDGGDLGCARLLVLLRGEVAGLDAGTVVHLTTSDPVAPIDLPVWCRMTGHEYLGPVGAGGARQTYAVVVAANPVATQPGSPWRVAT